MTLSRGLNERECKSYIDIGKNISEKTARLAD